MKKIFSMNRFEGWNLSLPLIQGGMGVGVSLSGLAGAVASEGGMGVISTAQIGFEEPDFVGNEEACNLRSIRKHIVRAKELASGKGMIAVNVMVALQQYREHVKEAVRAGADAVICGAGLPVDLPELVEAGKAKIAPIVSSRRAAALLLKTWDKKYGRTADFIVTEGPEAGGHLGFSREQLDDISKIRFEEELTGIVEEKKKYEEKAKELKDSLGQIEEQLTTIKSELSEKVHTENVKCYRNIQDLFRSMEEKVDHLTMIEDKQRTIGVWTIVTAVLGIVNLIALTALMLINLGVFA